MYICICNALTDKDVQAALDEGAVSPAEIFGHHGVELECAQCVPLMQRMIGPRTGERRVPGPDRRLAARPIGSAK